MADIKPKDKGSWLKPLKTLSFLFKEPVTLPMKPRPAAERYRGFHLNDWDKCIGCGTCSEICDNHAIRMVHVPELPTDEEKGVKPFRPALDYGRCCWCALCVDICPTGAISLSREYIHVGRDKNEYFFLPDEDGIHGEQFEKGWAKDDDSDLLDHSRQPMEELPAEERIGNFGEIVAGFDDDAALKEASRCIQCGMCHEACPAHMHAPEYIRAIWEGDYEEAIRQIYRTNPFPQVCGRVCTHRCEDACSIGRRGDPVAIRWLKRFAVDSVDHERAKQIAMEGKKAEPTGKKVAIVGSGPASLTAAFDLAKRGHKVKVYEAKPEAGGMMRYGIPEYRMPYDKLDDDIDIVRAAGVEIICDTPIGDKITMAKLKQANDAVMLGVGLSLGRSTRVPGTDHPKVVSAVEHLTHMTTGKRLTIPESVVVIGGGNVAFDIARSYARKQKRKFGKVNVTMTVLEARDAMLADETEVIEAQEEGIVIHNGRGPKQMLKEGRKLVGLETVRCVSIFDEEGRFHPKYDEADIMQHQGDLVIEAIGQMTENSFLGEDLIEDLQWARGRIKVDKNGRTSENWLWAAGDMVEGPDVIHAIAAGYRAANSIHASMARKKVKS